jgi:hypothetical protein
MLWIHYYHCSKQAAIWYFSQESHVMLNYSQVKELNFAEGT